MNMGNTEITYNCFGECKIEATGEDAKHIIKLLEAEKDGRLVLTGVKPEGALSCGIGKELIGELINALRRSDKELREVTEERNKLRDGIKKIMQGEQDG